MDSYFERIFKQVLINKYINNSRKENYIQVKDINIDVNKEYRKILDKVAIKLTYYFFEDKKMIDAILNLTTAGRIIIIFNIVLEIDLYEIAYLLNTNINSVYSQKSKAIKQFKNLK